MFEGAEQEKAWSDIVQNFWDSGKRNMLVRVAACAGLDGNLLISHGLAVLFDAI